MNIRRERNNFVWVYLSAWNFWLVAFPTSFLVPVLSCPLNFGLYFFLWCSYTELILKSKGKWGTVHHSVGSRSLEEASVLQEQSFCDKAQSGSTVIRLLNETLNKRQKSEAVKSCGIPMMSFPKQIQVRIVLPMVVVCQCASVWKLDHATKNSQWTGKFTHVFHNRDKFICKISSHLITRQEQTINPL